MTKLVFHIGDHKTGTTAIQSTLASKAYTTNGTSVLYPTPHRLQHLLLAKAVTDPGPPGQRAARFREVRDEIEAHQPDVTILSAEHFEDANPADLKRAIEEHLPDYAASARVIAYVRPHAERFVSSFAERVKIGLYSGTMEVMHTRTLQTRQFIYTARFQRWRDTFGPQFELRPMVRDLLHQRDVVADLFSYVLGADGFTLDPVTATNESVSLENLAILRRFQMALRSDKDSKGMFRNALGWSIARRMNASAFGQGTKVQLHRDLATAIARDYAKDAAELDAAFFTGTPMTDALRDAPSKAVPEAQSLNLEDHFSAREIYLIDLMVDQMSSVVLKDPAYFAKIIREDHRTTVAPIDEDSAPPKRRKAKPHAAGKAGPRKRGAAARP